MVSILTSPLTPVALGLCVIRPFLQCHVVVTVERILHPEIMPPILAWPSIDATIKLSLKKGRQSGSGSRWDACAFDTAVAWSGNDRRPGKPGRPEKFNGLTFARNDDRTSTNVSCTHRTTPLKTSFFFYLCGFLFHRSFQP